VCLNKNKKTCQLNKNNNKATVPWTRSPTVLTQEGLRVVGGREGGSSLMENFRAVSFGGILACTDFGHLCG